MESRALVVQHSEEELFQHFLQLRREGRELRRNPRQALTQGQSTAGQSAASTALAKARPEASAVTTTESLQGLESFLEDGQVKGGKMPALVTYASSTKSTVERLQMLEALQRSSEQRLQRFVALEGPKLLCQWIQLEVPLLSKACLQLLRKLPVKKRVLVELQLPDLLQQLADPDLASEVAKCRETWKLSTNDSRSAEGAAVKKRKVIDDEKRKKEEELLHEIRNLGDVLENSDFCVDSLFEDPFKQVSSLQGLKVTYIAAGEAHTAAVDQLGGLYTWGQGSYGRCGHGLGTDMPSPARVESLSGLSMSQVALGLMHSVTMSVKGQLYTWGKGPATGFDGVDVITTPRQVKLESRDPVYQISAGPLHTVVLMQTGDVLYFGSGTEGRLPYRNAFDGQQEDVASPTLLKPPDLKVKAWAQEKTKALRQSREAIWWPSRLCCGSSSSAVLTGAKA
eukprot:symbB.v1.2.040254.t1/scaffold7102.1/size13317/2